MKVYIFMIDDHHTNDGYYVGKVFLNKNAALEEKKAYELDFAKSCGHESYESYSSKNPYATPCYIKEHEVIE